MKKCYFCLLLLFMVGTVRSEDTPPAITAHLTGRNYGEVDTNVVVTAEEQKVFHFHSDFQGGGTWYDAFISVKDGTVTIVERDSVSSSYKSGSKVNTTEDIYRLPVDRIERDEVELLHGNRIVLTRATKDGPTKQPEGIRR